jgi:hypothetical protein
MYSLGTLFVSGIYKYVQIPCIKEIMMKIIIIIIILSVGKKRFFSALKRSDRLWSPPKLLFNG